MNTRQPWIVFTLWVAATVGGVLIGVLAVLTPVSRLALLQVPAVLTGLLGGAGLGAVLGLAQWLLVRRFLAAAGWWIPASIAGAACGAALGMAAAAALGPLSVTAVPAERPSSGGMAALLNIALPAAIGGAGFGLGLGIAQWLVLRRDVAGAGRWIVANSLGWPAALGVGAACMAGGGLLAGLLVAGVLAGSATGAVVVRLVSDDPQQPAASRPAYNISRR